MNALNLRLEQIQRSHPKSIDLCLTRIATVAIRLALFPLKMPVITVAGTNGKGTSVALLERIYLLNDYQTGVIVSPHLFHYNERVRVNGEVASDEEIIAAFDTIDDARKEITLTYFEYGILAALIIFRAVELDVLILEVGLGGRLDAVNIVDADLALITTIDLDHLDYLGPDRDSVGREKAGIMRPNKPCVCGDPEPPDSVLHAAKKMDVPLAVQQHDFYFKENANHWDWQGTQTELMELPIPHIPLQNASAVLQVIETMKECLPVTDAAIHEALASIKVPGRMQKIPGAVMQIFDVAHNPQAAEYLASQLNKMNISGDIYAVFSMLETKDIAKCIAPFLSRQCKTQSAEAIHSSSRHCEEQSFVAIQIKDIFSHWAVAPLAVDRAASLEQLKTVCETFSLPYTDYSSIEEARLSMLERAKTGDCVVVFGSFHTVGSCLTV